MLLKPISLFKRNNGLFRNAITQTWISLPNTKNNRAGVKYTLVVIIQMTAAKKPLESEYV
ncbi:hypothetical protein FCV65_18170 [Vibrio sp. F13]|nr:hypothetical protein FCV65_18170 [Vibrio sp. F13]